MEGAEIVGIILVALLYLALLGLFFVFVAPFAAGAGAAAMTVAVLVNYVRAIADTIQGGGFLDSPDGPEPAFRQYFYRKAYKDLWLVLEASFKYNERAVRWVVSTGTGQLKGERAWLTWPLGVVFLVVAFVGILVAFGAYVAFGVLHVAAVAVGCGIAAATALGSRMVEYTSMLIRRIFLACPHTGCYRKIALPHYVCPGCGAIHRRLLPGSYGTFRRRCACGRKLPTLFLFGRAQLQALCPHPDCGRPLAAATGTVRNFHISIVGGPAAGKSSLLVASLIELRARARGGRVDVQLQADKDKRQLEASVDGFARGVVVPKTAQLSPDAIQMKITGHTGGAGLLYVYDTAGELFQDTDEIRRHEYYSYAHSILFLIDPFSLRQVRVDLAGILPDSEAGIRPSEEPPGHVYQRMIVNLRQLAGKSGLIRRPIAVVLTKVDALGIDAQVDRSARAIQAEPRPSREPEPSGVRRWLMDHGEGNLVRAIEQDFSDVRYFSCSALGRVPDGSALVPRHALAPLEWSLSRLGLVL